MTKELAIRVITGDVLGTSEQTHEAIKMAVRALSEPERKNGRWGAKEVADNDSKIITQWQSCKCSECGRYDTRPYLYYFSEPNFCSFCGADMRGEEDENN